MRPNDEDGGFKAVNNMLKSSDKQEEEFLKESNAIEMVYGEGSLEDAKKAWDYLCSQDTMSIDVVLKTHRILMENKDLLPHEIGFLRRVPVYIGGKEAIDWTYILPTLHGWAENMNRTSVSWDNESMSKRQHVEYEKIHPFVDGNGRTGRMFMNWWRLKNGLPLLVIHEGDEQMEYYKWFK